MSTIFVYCDEGVCPNSLRATVRSLKAAANRPVQLVDRHTLICPGWEEQAALIIFPGGRDVPYANALQGAANQRIRKYVEKGGRYFGICAGGYYGCDSISFEKGGPLEVMGQRELKFFPGQAIGPALGLRQFSYGGLDGACVAKIGLSSEHFSIDHAEAYYNGGNLFSKADSYPKVQVLARFEKLEEQSAAIVLCHVGQGKAILSGVHPEYSAKDLPMDAASLRSELVKAEPKRKELFAKLLTLLIN
jgi:biotin--protein ligase